MSGGGYGLIIMRVAAGAAMLNHALAGTAFNSDFAALIPIMAQCGGIIIDIAVAAVVACVNGIATFQAVRLLYLRYIMVSGGKRIITFIVVITVFAGIGSIAHGQASRFSHFLHKIMAFGLGKHCAADLAGLRVIASGGRAGRMILGWNGFQIVRVAARAAIFQYPFADTGTLCYCDRLFPVMIQRRGEIIDIAVAAMRT